MSELARIKQAMADGEHTDGYLAWCVEEIESLKADNGKLREWIDELSIMPLESVAEWQKEAIICRKAVEAESK